MYGLFGKLIAVEGKGNELSSILLKAAKYMKSNLNCHLYVIGIDLENEDLIWITEVWRSKEDHDISLQNEEVKGLITKAIPLLDVVPTKGTEFKIIGGKGLWIQNAQ